MYELPPGAPAGIPEMTGTDETIEGVPATRYQGHFEVYYSDTTVVIFGDAAPKDYVAGFLVEGPSRLSLLAEHGLYFDTECLDDIHGCQADRSRTSESTEHLVWVLFVWVLPLLVPFVAVLFIGRIWLLLIPLVEWPLIFLGLYMGWWGFGVGELWQLALVMWMLVRCCRRRVRPGSSVAHSGRRSFTATRPLLSSPRLF